MTRRTSVYSVARGLANVWVVEVIGTRGSARLYRRSLTEARATARRYAALLDAPHKVI